MIERREECIEFGSPTLRGIVHIPEGKPKAGVVFLHGWAGYRIGPHGMFVKTARRLASNGILALRFDFRGRGNSDGDRLETDIDMKIQDALSAVELLRKEYRVGRVYLLGICSGGNVALGTASLDKSIDGLVLWSTPLFAPYKKRIHEAQRKADILREYFSKLFRKETVRKLIRGEIHFGILLERLSGKKPPRDLRDSRRDIMKELTDYQGQVLLIYGTKDDEAEGAPEFYKEFFSRNRTPPEIHFIEGANHSFYSVEWEEEVIGITMRWFSEHMRRL